MGWEIKKITNDKERAAAIIRDILLKLKETDKNGGRGYAVVATAIEQVLQAFGDLNEYSLEIISTGSISSEGKGLVTIVVQTLDPDVFI